MNPNKKSRLIKEAVKAAEEFKQQGKIQESVDEYLRAAELLKTLKGNEKQYAGVLNDAAIGLANLAQYSKAKQLVEKALLIQKKYLGGDHISVAMSLNNLANVYSDLGDYEQAKELYQRALAIFELQNEVGELQQELIEAEKFKFLGQIMTQVAHNINNPLQIIHGNVTGALDDLNEGLFNAETELRPLLQNLKQQTDRISNLIQDFRKLAQGDRKKLETVNLNQLAEQAAEYLRGQFLIHKIQLVIEPMQPAPLAHSNALVVTEAIVNLLSNAKDALTGQKAAKVTLSTWEDAQHVGIKVEDNGKGIHPEQQSQLFHTLYPSQKTVGWGLGLYTSHHTLKSLGGKIVYTSQNQGGACFTIILKKARNHV